jgi:hypothetical protein
MTCETCGSQPCVNPSFCQACREADRRKARGEQPHDAARSAPPPIANLPKANFESGDWKQIAAEAWNSPGRKQSAAEYQHARGGRTVIREDPPEKLARLRRLLSDSVSLDAAWHQLGRDRPASQGLIDALVYALRRGVSELIRPDTQQRLAALAEDQLELVCRRVQDFKSRIAPAWSADDVGLLISAWRKFHGRC